MTILWISGKVISQSISDDGFNTTAWEFHGVFDSEEKAKESCHDEMYFIGPSELNKPFPAEQCEWADSYYPKAN